MKTVTCTNAKLEVVDQPTPTPAKGQLLIDVLRCGICGSDLHARHHCDELADVMAESGYDAFMRSNQHVVFGHEFCGEVVDYGPGTRKAPRTGTPVVALPLLRRGKEVHGIGLSTMAPGRLRRAAPRRAVADVSRPKRVGARDGRADRADGRRMARRPARRGGQAATSRS